MIGARLGGQATPDRRLLSVTAITSASVTYKRVNQHLAWYKRWRVELCGHILGGFSRLPRTLGRQAYQYQRSLFFTALPSRARKSPGCSYRAAAKGNRLVPSRDSCQTLP